MHNTRIHCGRCVARLLCAATHLNGYLFPAALPAARKVWRSKVLGVPSPGRARRGGATMPPPTARGAQLTVPTSAEMDMAQHVGAGTAPTRPQTPTSRAGGVLRGRKIFFPAQCSARARAGAAGAARAAPQSGKTRVGIWPLAAPLNRASPQKTSTGGLRLLFQKNMFFRKAKNADPFTLLATQKNVFATSGHTFFGAREQKSVVKKMRFLCPMVFGQKRILCQRLPGQCTTHASIAAGALLGYSAPPNTSMDIFSLPLCRPHANCGAPKS